VRLRGWPSASRLAMTFAVLALVTAAGCSGADPDPANVEPASADVKRALAVRAQMLDRTGRLFEAEAQLSKRCMERKGFTVHPPASKPVVTDDYPYPATPSVDVARRSGYFGEQMEPAPGDLSYQRLAPQEMQRYAEALNGGGPGEDLVLDDGSKLGLVTGGCRGQTLTGMYGDIRTAVSRIHQIDSSGKRAQQATDADARVTAILAKWADCMRDAGYSGITTPEQARIYVDELAKPGSNPGSVRAQGIAVAVAHAQCSQKVEVDRLRKAVWEHYLGKDLLTHEAEIVAVVELQDAALERAQALMRAS
jgi:hypothetical protein